MRATELVQRRSDAARRRISAALEVDGWDLDAIVQAMRSPRVARHIELTCQQPALREDLWLIAANPFDPILPDEVVDADRLLDIGLIEEVAGQFEVNVDFALTLAPLSPVEFGFCATLLARMPSTDLALTARAVEVGPRASMVDYILDIASECINVEAVNRRLAHLRAAERTILEEALALGDLPDSIEGLDSGTARPEVSCELSPAGQRALVFLVGQPARGIARRPVVPLELAESLRDLLVKVPPAPEVDVRRVPTRRRRTRVSEPTTRNTQATHRVPLTLTGESIPLPIALPLAPAPFSTPTNDRTTATGERSAVTTVQANALHRYVQGRPAAGVVDLEEPRFAEAARNDAELGAAILEVVAQNLVVLRPGTDVSDWAERAAEKLAFH